MTFMFGVVKFCGIAYKRKLLPKETVMAYSHKLTEIDSIVDEMAAIERLLELSNDEDWEVRCRAIEKIGEYPLTFRVEKVMERIRQGLLDSNEFVRSSCIDILGEWKDTKSINRIISYLTNDCFVVRIAAAEAIGVFGDSSKAKYLEERLSQVDDDNEQVFCYFGLFLLGQHHYLDSLLKSLSSDYYRTRCAAANLLISCATDKNKIQIIEQLKNALDKENTAAASSSLTNAIYEIENDLA